MLNRSATNTRIARKSASKPSPLNRWRRHNALKRHSRLISATDLYRGEGEGRRWGGWEQSVATSVGRKPLGNRVPDEDKNSVEFARAAAGKLERKGARVWLPPVSARFCLREFHPANRTPRPPLSLSSLAILLLRGGGAISSTPRAEWNCQPCFSGGHHRAVPIGHGPRPAIDPRGTREALVHRPRRIRPSFRQGLYFMCVCVRVYVFYSNHVLDDCIFLASFLFCASNM